jgi:hypothetical protein
MSPPTYIAIEGGVAVHPHLGEESHAHQVEEEDDPGGGNTGASWDGPGGTWFPSPGPPPDGPSNDGATQ